VLSILAFDAGYELRDYLLFWFGAENQEDYGDGIWKRNGKIVSLGDNSRDIKIVSTRAGIQFILPRYRQEIGAGK
jgi:hypothetical protein